MNPNKLSLATYERRFETCMFRLNEKVSIFIGGKEVEFVMSPGIIRSYKEEAAKYLLLAIKVRMDIIKDKYCEQRNR